MATKVHSTPNVTEQGITPEQIAAQEFLRIQSIPDVRARNRALKEFAKAQIVEVPKMSAENRAALVSLRAEYKALSEQRKAEGRRIHDEYDAKAKSLGGALKGRIPDAK